MGVAGIADRAVAVTAEENCFRSSSAADTSGSTGGISADRIKAFCVMYKVSTTGGQYEKNLTVKVSFH